MERKTGIIKSLKVGRVDHYNGIIVSCSIDMNGSGCGQVFTMDEALQMMNDVGVYDDINLLVGKPCEIVIDDMNKCHFVGMWKK